MLSSPQAKLVESALCVKGLFPIPHRARRWRKNFCPPGSLKALTINECIKACSFLDSLACLLRSDLSLIYRSLSPICQRMVVDAMSMYVYRSNAAKTNREPFPCLTQPHQRSYHPCRCGPSGLAGRGANDLRGGSGSTHEGSLRSVRDMFSSWRWPGPLYARVKAPSTAVIGTSPLRGQSQ